MAVDVDEQPKKAPENVGWLDSVVAVLVFVLTASSECP